MNERDIFMAAVQRDGSSERLAYLAEVCQGDEELRKGVEALLEAHERAGGFLAEPAVGVPGPADEPPLREGPGMVIGPYKLLEQIGEGGFGVVYMAEQHRPVRRKVALKVLKPGMDTRQVVGRFEAERQALALMDHPNIAHVLDGGETANGRPYFVMELVRGIAITTFCDENHMPVRGRLQLYVNVCQAVQHAHHKGIIHRDLKPSNILVTLHDGAPVVKVIDFGIAKALGQQLTDKTLFTNFAQMVGTPIYMSPEQAEMSGLDMDTRTDVYSLGVLLYELLTGMTPCDKERLKTAAYDEIRRIIREEEPVTPSKRLTTMGLAATVVSANRQCDPQRLSQSMRGELDWIVMKALEKDRTRRYESASALAADVQRYLADEPVLACPPSTVYRLKRLVRRHRGPAIAAALLVLALVGGIIGTTWGMFRATKAKAEVEEEAKQKQVALTDKEAALTAAEDQLFLALLNQARAGRFSQQMGQRLDSLAALEKAARIRPDDRLRDEAIAALALPDIRRGATLHACPSGTKDLVFDGLYQSYARLNGAGVVSIRTVPDNVEIQSIDTKTTANAIRVSPNGQFLAARDDQLGVQVWRVTDGKPLLREAVQPGLTLAFSPNSRQLAVAKDDCVLAIDLASGQETNRWHLPGRPNMLAFHPQNRKLAVGYFTGNVVSIFDAVEGSLVADLPVGSVNNQIVAWHPDGARLAVAGLDPRIQIWDVEAKRKLATLEGHVELVTSLSFHPDGGLLASHSWDGSLRLWDPATGRQLMQMPLAVRPRFGSAGQLGYLREGEENVRLIEATSSSEYRTIVSNLGAGQGAYHDGAISPDGRLLALGMGEGGDRLWDLSSGKELANLPSGSHCVFFQSDGSSLFTCGSSGFHRWPIQAKNEGERRLGPSQGIPVPFVPMRATRSGDGRMLAVASEASGAGLIMDLSSDTKQVKRLEHPWVHRIEFSQDGRWVATCGWHSDRVRLWNAKTGEMVNQWILGTETEIFFTPDSRALIICRGDAFTFWDVETLQPIRRLVRDVAPYPGHVAFSPDGGLMALEMAPAIIYLKEVATGRTIAKLEDPHGDRARWMSFTPDGTKLVAAAPYAKALHVWDLRAIRERLKVIGLDWDWPEFKPADPKAKAVQVTKVEVSLADWAKQTLTPEQKARLEIEQCRLEVEANPNSATAYNALAWTYLTAPVPLRDEKAALVLAEKALRLPEGKEHSRNTLSLAYYRAGRYREAVELLRPNLAKQNDEFLAFDLYFLAMSHQQLGETDLARNYLAWAIRWTAAQRNTGSEQMEELKLFRAEAEELMKIGEKKK